MRVIRNVGHVRQQKSRAKWLTLGGFVLFLSGFAFVGFLDNVMFAYVTLVPAYVLFIAGMQQLGKWTNSVRRPRGDLQLDESLKHLPDRYTLIHYAKSGSAVLEHVLLHPGGALLIVLRDVGGRIELKRKRFRRVANPIARMVGASGPPLGQPDRELDEGETALAALLKERQAEIDVTSVVVFTAPDHELVEVDPELDAIAIGDLPDYVRVLEPDPSFKQQERDQIATALAAGPGFERNEPERTRRPVVVKRRAT
jgi:hypothetical protein